VNGFERQQVAPRYANAPRNVAFELLNEPHDALNGEPWNALLAAVLGVVRQSNPTRIVVVGPTHWNSLKDLPVRSHDQLAIAAYPERADPRDVLVSEVATRVRELPRGAHVLTGSLRRQAQLLALRPDLEMVPVRGNVETRLRKRRESGAEATVLAAAGLARLGLVDEPAHPLEADELLPAPGQGTLAVQTRRGEAEALCAALDHPPTRAAAMAERAIVAAFGGDCTLPLAAWAREVEGRLVLTALLAAVDGSEVVRGEVASSDPGAVATACVVSMRDSGADALLDRIHSAVRSARAAR